MANTICMGIVGVPGVTIEVPVTQDDRDQHNPAGKRSVERVTFDAARSRFREQGAKETRYFIGGSVA